MSSYILSTIEIDGFCFGTMLFILYKIFTTEYKNKFDQTFLNIIYSGLLFCVIDVLRNIIIMQNNPDMLFLYNIAFSMYLVYYAIAGYYVMYHFAKDIISEECFKYPPVFFIYFTPALFYSFLTMTDLSIVINKYDDIVFNLYIGIIGVTTIILAFKSYQSNNFKNTLKTIQLPLLFIGFALLHTILEYIPISIGFTIIVLSLYLNIIQKILSTDNLTQFNNKNNIIYTINNRITSLSSNSKLYVFIIDGNNFKEINDDYGEREGDACLLRLADSLKKACNKLRNQAYIGRYVGDEFVVVYETLDIKEVLTFLHDINYFLAQKLLEDNCKYDFSVSIGYSIYNHNDSKYGADELIKEADRALYRNKKETISARV